MIIARQAVTLTAAGVAPLPRLTPALRRAVAPPGAMQVVPPDRRVAIERAAAPLAHDFFKGQPRGCAPDGPLRALPSPRGLLLARVTAVRPGGSLRGHLLTAPVTWQLPHATIMQQTERFANLPGYMRLSRAPPLRGMLEH